MRPVELLARERTADDEELTLTRRAGVYWLTLSGQTLMSSLAHGSELALASLSCTGLAAKTGRSRPRVVIGRLRLRLHRARRARRHPASASVVVWEISPMVLAANRGEVGDLAGRPLDDPRLRVVSGDVWDDREPFDAILLDADNGPNAFTLRRNERLYSPAGLARLHRSLVPGGVLAIWSEARDNGFGRRLTAAGFATEVHGARGAERAGTHFTIFVARRR